MKYALIFTLFTLLAVSPVGAQMDDVYYNPDEVVKLKNNPSSSNRLGSYRPESYSENETSFSDGTDSYYDDMIFITLQEFVVFTDLFKVSVFLIHIISIWLITTRL